MKIFQITAYYPPHLGGMQNVVKEISERLAKKGHEVEVFTSDIGCPKDKQIKSTKNLKINYLPAWEFAHTPIIPSLFWELMKIPKNSIIHVHVAQPLIPEIVKFTSRLIKTPYITQLHSDVGASGKLGVFLPVYKRLFLKKVLKNAAKCLVLNEEYKELLKEKYLCEKNVQISSNGVGKEFFKIKKSYKKDINLLYVGRLSIEKNIDRLIRSVCQLKNKTILHIVGDGEKKQELEELVMKLKLNNVIFHGRKEGKDLLRLYQKADIFLLASSYEGQPLVLLEAMASGVPIIASDVKGVHELVSGTGILVNPPTITHFSEKIDQLIRNRELRKKLSKRGREKAKQYSWDKIVNQLEKVYSEVTNEY